MRKLYNVCYGIVMMTFALIFLALPWAIAYGLTLMVRVIISGAALGWNSDCPLIQRRPRWEHERFEALVKKEVERRLKHRSDN